MSQALIQRLRETRAKVLLPKSKLNLVEWADTYRYLSSESSSTPGVWKTNRVEPAREPMLAVTDPKVKKITVMACTQLMKTELINNIVGYFIHQDPAPMIVMQPTGKAGESWSKDRLDKMIRDTKVLRGLVKDKKSRDSENTILHKGFPGGHITVVGSNSPTDLASRPIRVVLCDEIDKYPDSAGNEGDPVALIQERTDTFWNSLLVSVCSPTVAGRSRIEQEYEQSDKRVYHVPCPHCGHAEEMQWVNVRWEKDQPETALYHCPECKAAWSDEERCKAISKGYYVATAPFTDHAGFKVSKLASPWSPVSKMAVKWVNAQGDIDKLKTFVNTQLAETWEEEGESPEHMRLYERRELYDINTCPPGVLFLTAGVDVQKDRLELEIVGWGEKKESWSIDYRVIEGETSSDTPWVELSKVLNETWTLSNGSHVQIRKLAVDSGFNSQHVYNWVRKYPGNRVLAVKGSDNLEQIVGIPKAIDVNHKGERVARSVRVWPVGVSVCKTELYGWLQQDGAGDDGVYPTGYCHFPEYSEEYFKQLTAEKLVRRKKDGQTVFKWVKHYERNEPLDCRNYARAAASVLGMDRFKEEDWKALVGEAPRPKEPVNPPLGHNYVKPKRPNEGSFWGPSKSKLWK